MTTLHGLHIPLITPYDASGRPALDTLETLAHTLLEAGATGLVALGTTGEPSALTPTERRTIVDAITPICRHHRAHLLVGANDPEMLRTLHGADAALTLVPPFTRPGEDGVIAHLTNLAAQSPVPLVIYHVPYRTAQPLSTTALRRIAAIDGVTGIKLAAGGIDTTVVELMADPPDNFTVLGGDDLFISPLLAMGAHGAILASAHVETTAYADLVQAWRKGDTTRARQLGNQLARLSAALFAEPNPTVIKGVLHHQGHIPTPDVRLPLVPASTTAVRAALAAIPQPAR